MTIEPTRPTTVRAEPRPCKVCGREILGGQLYVVSGPCHVICQPPRRLDVPLVIAAARQR